MSEPSLFDTGAERREEAWLADEARSWWPPEFVRGFEGYEAYAREMAEDDEARQALTLGVSIKVLASDLRRFAEKPETVVAFTGALHRYLLDTINAAICTEAGHRWAALGSFAYCQRCGMTQTTGLG